MAGKGVLCLRCALPITLLAVVYSCCNRQNASEPEDFTALVARVRPAVVAIQVTRSAEVGESLSSVEELAGLGSGFLVRRDGLLVTNYHVVEGASDIKVIFYDGRHLPARLVGGEKKYDLALLKVEGGDKFPALELGDSTSVKVGAWVVAVGNPLGLALVSKGIVSGKGRHLGELPLVGKVNVDFIQTDAVTDVGSSGGPLVDLQGKVVGINSAINIRGRGIGFAIPVDLLKALLPHLEKEGKLRPAFIGVSVEDVKWEQAEVCGLDRARGALVKKVKENSPAVRGGLLPGDIIVAINGIPVEGVSDVGWRIATWPAGKPLGLSVIRGKEQLQLTVIPQYRQSE